MSRGKPEQQERSQDVAGRSARGGAPLAGVILCAGKGTRMGRTRSHKVCAPIAGRPAVVRLIDTLRADGVDPVVVVVGHQAGDVIEAIGSAHPGVHFVYQRDRLGTGHAARIGIEALCQFHREGAVLVTMGDKWLAPRTVAGARQRFDRAGAELLVVTTPKRPESTAGRLVNLAGRGIVGIVELRDIQRARVLGDWVELTGRRRTIPRAMLRSAGLRHIRPARKLWRALGPLARFCRGTGAVEAFALAQVIRETGLAIPVAGTRLGPDRVEQRSPTVNESVYIGRIDVLEEALRRVGRANAQDEFYLTDVVEIIARGLDPEAGARAHRRVIEHRLRPQDVMAFNTRAELARIIEHVRRCDPYAAPVVADRHLARYTRTPEQWYAILDAGTARGRRLVERTYGWGGPLVPGRLGAMRQVVRLFTRTYGADRRILLVRAPGRVNLMGRHIDHQGGFVHSMALDCEVIIAAGPRDDDVIRLVNADRVAFPPRELVIGDWIPALRAPDWLSFVDGQAVGTHLLSARGDWSNYVLASVLFQQFRQPGRRLRGMDMAVAGNIPMAAGLSSSSAVVVGAMEAVTAINGIRADGSVIVSACGQAEWFVGSRGGAADHAAIRLGRAGHAARMGFHPFRLSRYVPVPPRATLLIAFSGEHAVKSAGARDRFNERVACYRLAILLLRKRYPSLTRRLEHMRDLSPARLGVPRGEVLRMLAALPERITRAQLRRELGRTRAADLERIFASHSDPGQYSVRDVATFGVGECERSRIAAACLARGDLAGFGEFMRISHDGDRVSSSGASDGQDMDSMPLHRLVGGYGCSTRSLDRLVDLAREVPGVYGAQLAGAGLGGCAMILAEQRAARRVKAKLSEQFYEPRGMAPAIWIVRSVSGGGLVRP